MITLTNLPVTAASSWPVPDLAQKSAQPQGWTGSRKRPQPVVAAFHSSPIVGGLKLGIFILSEIMEKSSFEKKKEFIELTSLHWGHPCARLLLIVARLLSGATISLLLVSAHVRGGALKITPKCYHDTSQG